MRDVIDPVNVFNNFVRNWWKILVGAIIGGLMGFIISFFLPPTYEAEAIFSASIDFTEINFENLVDNYGNPVVWTQYEEDLALQVVERMLLKQFNDVLRFARTLDPSLEVSEFRNSKQIERYLSMWYLRYRHSDPEIAQLIVNFWVDKGSKALLAAKESGTAESFVIVELVSEAERPQTPLYQHRGTLILAGTLIGFLGGVIWIDFQYRHLVKQEKEA
ncbi:MAG: Wzz/FepE/Etk N-terminal domain-containing protein [Chloroflexota bacterium]|nr:Wzz/FepE/Etk N-terminal domain-containing protein [Chloroflexota bacterium]